MKKPRKELPALTDPRYLDATFLFGPNQEAVITNRAVFAIMKRVLSSVEPHPL